MLDDRLQPVRDVANPYIDDILVGTWVEPGEDLLAALDRDFRKVLELLKAEEFIVGKWKLFVKEVDFYGGIWGYVNPPPENSWPSRNERFPARSLS